MSDESFHHAQKPIFLSPNCSNLCIQCTWTCACLHIIVPFSVENELSLLWKFGSFRPVWHVIKVMLLHKLISWEWRFIDESSFWTPLKNKGSLWLMRLIWNSAVLFLTDYLKTSEKNEISSTGINMPLVLYRVSCDRVISTALFRLRMLLTASLLSVTLQTCYFLQ